MDKGRRFITPVAGLAIFVLVVSTAVVVIFWGAGSPTPRQEAGANSIAATARGDSTSDASQTAITVHGHWTIRVMNPDGTVVEEREFENGLVGGPLLSGLLARSSSVGLWAVRLTSSNGAANGNCGVNTDPNDGIGPGKHGCVIAEPGATFTQAFQGSNTVFSTLTISVPSSGPNTGKFVLGGTATATFASDVRNVETMMAACGASVAPATPCTGTAFNDITATNIPQSIYVDAGQLIQITVVISFT